MRILLTGLIFITLGSASAQSKAPHCATSAISPAQSVEAEAISQAAFELTNRERVNAGLRPLAWDPSLAEMGYLHSSDMAVRGYFSHTSLENEGLQSRAERCSIWNWRMLAENIASNRGYKDPAATSMVGWMNSTGHRENILNTEVTHLGVGAAQAADGTWYLTQDFARF